MKGTFVEIISNLKWQGDNLLSYRQIVEGLIVISLPKTRLEELMERVDALYIHSYRFRLQETGTQLSLPYKEYQLMIQKFINDEGTPKLIEEPVTDIDGNILRLSGNAQLQNNFYSLIDIDPINITVDENLIDFLSLYFPGRATKEITTLNLPNLCW